MMLLKKSAKVLLLTLPLIGVTAAGECKCTGTAADGRDCADLGSAEVSGPDACEDLCKLAGCNPVYEDCIGANMQLYSCTAGAYLPAHQISIGDSVRTVARDGSSLCSEVYFTFNHGIDNQGAVLEIEVENNTQEKIVVTKNHLVYSGSTNKAVLAKKVQVGDMLVSSDGSMKKVTGVEEAQSALVNILTWDGSFELQNGIIISAYSFHESLYAAAFFPLKMMYWMIGASAVHASRPYLEDIERALKPSFVGLASMMSAHEL